MELLTAEVILPVSSITCEIHEGDGYNDRVLLKKGKRLYQVLPEYLASLITSINGEKAKVADVMQFLVPDYEFLLVESYKLNYGNSLSFMNVCSACGQLNKHDVDLSELPLIPLSEDITGGPDPVIDLVLPRTKKRARIGFLTVQNDMILNEQGATSGSTDLNQGDFLSLRMLEGSDPVAYEDVVRLPLMDHKAIRTARRQLQAGYDPLVSLICESCQNYDVSNILGLRDFLFPSG
jgi:hypothetical protein